MSHLDYAMCTWWQFIYKVDALVQKHRSQWHHTRLISYNIYCSVTEKNRLSIYDYLPLSGDPTRKERERMQKKADKLENKRRQAEAMKMIAAQKKFFEQIKLQNEWQKKV